MMMLLFFIGVALSCTAPVVIPDQISKSHSYQGVHDLEKDGVMTQWSCQQVDTNLHENNAIVFEFVAGEKMQIELSTCYGQTNFASRIIIGSKCENGVVSGCVGATDGDPNGQCDGHRSKLIMEATAGSKYYAMVMGLTNEDKGQFSLSIKAYTNPTNHLCSQAVHISEFPTSIGATITSDIDYSPTKRGYKRGFWYKFTAAQTTYVIDTCNKNTHYPTTIYMYKAEAINTGNQCMNSMNFMDSSSGCGNFARLYYDKYEVGKEYYIYVFFTEDSQQSPLTGSLEITFRTNGGENYKCPNAFAISKKPFNIVMNMKGMTPNYSPCHLSETRTGMYFSFRGDGRRYVFHTCFTGSSGIDHTYLELYRDGCDYCTESAGSVCGNDEMITLDTENDKLYRIRVSATNLDKPVTIGLMQVQPKDNYECEHARIMNVSSLGDQFTQYLIGSNQEKTANFNCNDGQTGLLGGWYKFTADKEDITIMHGIYTFMPGSFKGYLAELSSCTECVESTLEKYIAKPLTVPKGTTKYVFATTIRQEGVGKKYGAFMYWAVRSENKGGSYDNPYVIEAPFTGIFALGNHKLNHDCDQLIPSVDSFPGVVFKYEQTAEEEYIASSCGTETVVQTFIEVSKPNEKTGTIECHSQNTINDCGYGISMATSAPTTYYVKVGINPNTNEEKSVMRFNLYADAPEQTSQCTKAEKVETIPSSYYSYTTKAYASRGKCDILADGLKGKWFTYTPSSDEYVSITTDDVSTFNTQIAVYTECSLLVDVSIPGECVTGTDTFKTPIGQHGTQVKAELKKGTQYYIFVGGATNAESGLMRVKFDYYTPEDEEDESGLNGGEIFGIVFAALFIVAILIGIAAFVGYIIYKKVNATESSFNTF